MKLEALKQLVAAGESETLEFKRSTGELREVLQTVCAFANGSGGNVVVGVKPNGQIIGQQVSEQTFHEIADARDRFEPAIDVAVERIEVRDDREVLVIKAAGTSDSVPYTFNGRAYERVGNTTRQMSQERYEGLLLDRAHSRRRWENQVADEITIKDIDRDEVLRIIEAARSSGRLVNPVGQSLPVILERLGVRRNGKILRAAVVLFGKTFMPDYPQCELRMARFRGLDKTEFLDQRQIRGPAFKLLEEAELFCQRHFPLPGRIEPNRMERVDRPLIPPDAMREILVNALIHRDYSIAGGAISLAIFDDRVEVWSAGRFPTGITPDMLTRTHTSVQRNPIIAEVFHRAGLIEKWGRGTNRVAEMCRAAGISPPKFEEITGAAVVTFKVQVGVTDKPLMGAAAQPESPPKSQHQSSTSPVPVQYQSLEEKVLWMLDGGQLSVSEISKRLGQKRKSGQLKLVLQSLVKAGRVSLTIPSKPNSRLQKYRLTPAGKKVLTDLDLLNVEGKGRSVGYTLKASTKSTENRPK